MMKFNLTPYPTELIELGGTLNGTPYYTGEHTGSILYETMKEELGVKGDIPVQLVPATDEVYSNTEEGYILEITKEGISIAASTPCGHFYGVVTLLGVIKQFGKNLPCVRVLDKPTMAFRSGAFETGHGMKCRMDWFKSFIRRLALQKANYVYFSNGWMAFYMDPKAAPYYKDAEAITFEQAKELSAYAKRYNVSIIPACSIQGHADELLSLEAFSDMRETMEGEETGYSSIGNSFCPANQRAMSYVRELIDRVIEAFEPKIMHLGCDEIYSCGGDKACSGARQAIGKTGIILANCIRFRDYLEGKGIKLGIWGDMIVSLSGENRYDGTIEESRFKQSNDYYLAELRRNTIIFDWWYVGASEVSQQFFADKGFDTVACTSTHACMMHFASPQQQINMWKLFKGACKRNFYGGMITDWINMYGYHCEQTDFNQAAGLSMLWKGCDDNFINGVTREDFETAYMTATYGEGGKAVREYMHLAGDLYGDLLKIFSVKNRGVALRKVFFYEDNPLLFRLKFSVDLDNDLPAYEKAVARLQTLWAEIEKRANDNGYLEALHMPALLHEYLLTEYKIIDRVAVLYNEAAKAQFDDKATFKAKLAKCSEVTLELLGKSAKLYAFVEWLEKNCGNHDLSDLRIKGREENVKKLSRYFTYLQNDKRILPILKLLSLELFHTPSIHWWQEHIFEAAAQEGEFQTYDVDYGTIYESMDWEVPINK